MKPKEGTILTVAKGRCGQGGRAGGMRPMIWHILYREVIKEADLVLAKTPDMLPVLKQAGVVDSGGQGLVAGLKGRTWTHCLGKEIDYTIERCRTKEADGCRVHLNPYIDAQANQEITFTYCTQFLIMLEKPFSSKKEDMNSRSYLESIGDSIVVVADDEIVKVHVHTNDPGMAMQRALTYGSLTTIIIENMKLRAG